METEDMKIKDISLNNLRKRKGKALFLIIGLTIGVTTAITLISITQMMNEDISNKLDEYGANILILPSSNALNLSYGGMNLGGISGDIQTLKNTDVPRIWEIDVRENINIVSPKFFETVDIGELKIPLMGVRFNEEILLKKWWKIHGSIPVNQDEVLLGSEVASHLLKSSGDMMSINGRAVRITGVLEETGSQDDYLIFGDLSFVQDVVQKPEALSLIEVSAFCNTCPINEIVRQISIELPHAKVTAIKQTIQTKMEALDHLKKFSLGISIIVLFIGGMIVFTSVMASVNERKREIGIFRSVGFRKSHIVRIIFLEALIMSFIAGVMGFILGQGLSQVFGPMVTGIEPGKWSLDPVLAVSAVFLSVLIGILSSAYPANHASKMDPTDALRSL
jgi:putative ABC transport system permease protein